MKGVGLIPPEPVPAGTRPASPHLLLQSPADQRLISGQRGPWVATRESCTGGSVAWLRWECCKFQSDGDIGVTSCMLSRADIWGAG